MTTHTQWCQQKFIDHEDAAKRLCDTYNLHRVADPLHSIRRWFAAALHDGSSDGVLYDSKRDCILHQHQNEQFYTYICIAPSTMNACEAQVMLNTARRLYDAGFRLVDPDDVNGGKEVIKRLRVEDQLAAMRGQVTNLLLPEGTHRA